MYLNLGLRRKAWARCVNLRVCLMCMGSSEGNGGGDHKGHWTSTGLSLDLGLSPGSYPVLAI